MFKAKNLKFLHKYNLVEEIMQVAQKQRRTIALPEGEDERILKATEIIIAKDLAHIILLGNRKKIVEKIKKLKLTLPTLTIINPEKEAEKTTYAQKLYELRAGKGLTLDQAKELVKDPMYFATMMLEEDSIDGIVSGAIHPTSHTLRPALQIIKTKKDYTIASTYFIMLIQQQMLFFADCGMNINPDAKQLAEIALSTAKSVEEFNLTPRVALLSFSTKGSAEHEVLHKIQNALTIIKKKNPKLIVDGELQVDAALVPEVAKQKNPSSPIQGDANILIFPDLNSGNIGYKLVQRLAHATALGPIVQGLNKPVNDLSRGCSVEDIVEMVAITASQVKK